MKKEAAIVADTNFTFNGHRVLPELLPLRSDEDYMREIKDFRDDFWSRIDHWNHRKKKPEIIDLLYIEEKEASND